MIIIRLDLTPIAIGVVGRTWNAGGYRFGFNAVEKDDEWQGSGNSYVFGARIYDSRIGKWLSCDKKESAYPQYSPYLGIGNNPLIFSDPNGEEIVIEFIERKNEKPLVTVTISGAIINLSSKIGLDIESINNIVKSKVQGKYSGLARGKYTEKEVELNFVWDVNVVSKWSEVEEEDHVFIIAEWRNDKSVFLTGTRYNNQSGKKENVAEYVSPEKIAMGITPINGSVSYANADYFVGTWDCLFHVGETVLFHELCHLLGIPSSHLSPDGKGTFHGNSGGEWFPLEGITEHDRYDLFEKWYITKPGKYLLTPQSPNSEENGNPYLEGDLKLYIDEQLMNESVKQKEAGEYE